MRWRHLILISGDAVVTYQSKTEVALCFVRGCHLVHGRLSRWSGLLSGSSISVWSKLSDRCHELLQHRAKKASKAACVWWTLIKTGRLWYYYLCSNKNLSLILCIGLNEKFAHAMVSATRLDSLVSTPEKAASPWDMKFNLTTTKKN